MSCSIINLSDEILLGIIQKLLKDDELLHQKSLEAHRDQDDEYLCHQDLMNWSCTSRYFRNLLAPYIFRSIKLCNDEKSGASVETVLKGPHGPLVKEIYFVGAFEGDKWDNPVHIELPAVVDNLLSNLDEFPSIESLSVGFAGSNDSLFEHYYDVAEIMNPEPSVARNWKELIMITYARLLLNKPPQLKTVEIRKLIWTFTQPYRSKSFHELLSHIERFSLSVRGGENGAGWCINTFDGYLDCIAKFDKFFFDHLTSATSMILKASDEGPIGLQGMRHAPLALKKGQMPLLKTLHLEYIFICQELVDFVIGHTNTLEQLILHNCMSSVNGLQDNDGFYWSHFFNALHSAHLEKLAQLEIRPWNAPLTFDESMYRKYADKPKPEEEAMPDNVLQIKRILKEDTNRRVFGYATLDGKYGACDDDEEETQAAFERGEDQLAYDKLMKKVNANANKGEENPVGK